MHKTLLFVAASLALIVGTNSTMAFPVSLPQSVNLAAVQKITFWGESFPYGYNWSRVRACTRYEQVETPKGVHTKRVWVCDKRWRYSYR